MIQQQAEQAVKRVAEYTIDFLARKHADRRQTAPRPDCRRDPALRDLPRRRPVLCRQRAGAGAGSGVAVR